jgi:NTE family protein
VLRLVNEMVELLTADARAGGGVSMAPAHDRETGLPNAAVMREVVEFELGHARDGHDLLLIAVDLELPDVTPDAAATEAHELLTHELERNVRAGETVGRVAPGRYLIVLPRTRLEAARPVLRRLSAALERLGGPRLPRGARLLGRAAAWDASVSSADELLARCLAAPPAAVFPQPIATTTGTVPIVADARRVVLALGGGAARAMAHLGLLRVLRRHGVKVGGVAGTSAGAIVGALFAAGADVEDIVERFTSFARSSLYQSMRRVFAHGAAARSKARFLRGVDPSIHSEGERAALGDDLLAGFVEHFVGSDRLIQSLRVPFAAAATDLVAGRQITLSYGSLCSALRASCAIPGLFPPQRDGDRLLVDGSIVAEVPIAAAQQLGLPAPVLAAHLERVVPPVTRFDNATEIAARASALVHTQLVREQLRSAPLLVTIPVAEIGWLSFRDGAKLVAEGERAAEAAMPELLARLDGQAK